MAEVNEDDMAFFAEMQDVKPIKQSDTVSVSRREKTLAQQLKREALEREQRPDGNFLAIMRYALCAMRPMRRISLWCGGRNTSLPSSL